VTAEEEEEGGSADANSADCDDKWVPRTSLRQVARRRLEGDGFGSLQKVVLNMVFVYYEIETTVI
jgi:hypothetical protein